MDTDRYFNLQLTIQKLEEELSLYRNGTTGPELLELIREKDDELSAVKIQLQKSSDELAALKGNFSTLIKSSRNTLADNERMKAQLVELQATHATLTAQHTEVAEDLATTKEALNTSEEALQTATERLVVATQQNEDDAAMIIKLQEQGVGYVKKLNAQYSQIKEDEKKLKIMENKLQNMEVDTWKDKEKITELQLDFREQSKSYLKDKAAHTETITNAHKQLVSKVKEAEELSATVVSLQKALAEKETAYKQVVVERDDSVRELNRQVEHAQKNHEQFVKASKHAIDTREEHWKNEAERLEKLNQTDSARIKKYEEERSNLTLFKREMDMLKARNQELENRLQRQEQQLKTRLLRDRGNTLGAPEACSKPTNSLAGRGSRAIQSNQL